MVKRPLGKGMSVGPIPTPGSILISTIELRGKVIYNTKLWQKKEITEQH